MSYAYTTININSATATMLQLLKEGNLTNILGIDQSDLSRISDFEYSHDMQKKKTRISFTSLNLPLNLSNNNGMVGFFFKFGMLDFACITDHGTLNFQLEDIYDETNIDQIDKEELATDAIRLLLDDPNTFKATELIFDSFNIDLDDLLTIEQSV